MVREKRANSEAAILQAEGAAYMSPKKKAEKTPDPYELMRELLKPKPKPRPKPKPASEGRKGEPEK